MHRTKFSTTDLNQLQRQLKSWRQSQTQYSRLPEEVWAAATPLARKQGVSCVARVLGLDYCKLKERTSQTADSAARVAPPAGFVELQLQDLGSGASSPCRVELSDGAGGRMTLHLPGDSPAMVELAKAFWRRGQ